MSYMANIDIWPDTRDGVSRIVIAISETGSRDTSEWSTLASAANIVRVKGVRLVNGDAYLLPMAGMYLLAQSDRTAGTGTTIQPRWGKSSGWSDSTMAAIAGFPSAADYQSSSVPMLYSFAPYQKPILYGKSTPNSVVSDHDISSILLIEALV